MSLFAAAALAFLLLAPQLARAQASAIPSAAPPTPAGQTDTERGQTMVREMIAALGGDAWLNRATMQCDARGSVFFHGQPDPYTTDFHQLRRFPASGFPEAERIGFLTPRGVIMPGKKVDVIQIWKDGHGYEVTYKGESDLPKDQVADYYRRFNHSLDEVVRTWIHAPGVMVLSEGTDFVERHLADKVTILSANNDAVTIELDTTTHLPLRLSFQWRNPQFNDFDEEAETYDDYHTYQGIATPLTITGYHNGDITSQRFLSKVAYNVPVTPSEFDPAAIVPKLKR